MFNRKIKISEISDEFIINALIVTNSKVATINILQLLTDNDIKTISDKIKSIKLKIK